MENYNYGGEIPMGLSFALAQNSDAMKVFSGLSREEQQKIVEHTHSIQSRPEMQAYVDRLFQEPSPTESPLDSTLFSDRE